MSVFGRTALQVEHFWREGHGRKRNCDPHLRPRASIFGCVSSCPDSGSRKNETTRQPDSSSPVPRRASAICESACRSDGSTARRGPCRAMQPAARFLGARDVCRTCASPWSRDAWYRWWRVAASRSESPTAGPGAAPSGSMCRGKGGMRRWRTDASCGRTGIRGVNGCNGCNRVNKKINEKPAGIQFQPTGLRRRSHGEDQQAVEGGV